MRVLFVTAELSPLVKVGGLADAASGLVKALRDVGVDVEVVMPNYGEWSSESAPEPIEVPNWVGEAHASKIEVESFGPVTVVATPRMARTHPYTDDNGKGWPDNDYRFFSFSASVARLIRDREPDVVHLHDWHTGAVLGYLTQSVPAIFTIHNPAYQGTTWGQWLQTFTHRPEAYEWFGQTNPLTGAIALADAVTTVSPTFAEELKSSKHSFGLDGPLQARGQRFSGIINGLDIEVWNPGDDSLLPVAYDTDTAGKKREIARELVTELGWDLGREPLFGMVTRLTDQKGVDLALGVAERLDVLGARMLLLGSGDVTLASDARRIAAENPDRFAFLDAYDEGLAHRIFAASDLYLVPSRFEPCGLTQMQAMRYGAIPVVTNVGGLRDTVIDADFDPESGTGFVSQEVSLDGLLDASARAVSAWRSTRRRGLLRRRVMGVDWSWRQSAERYLELYDGIT